ncbi:MAG TPA: trypsin-like serine protease [Bdellovibrio sp.]|nr:trypsin-like serine protease [Bdellovibrio sp.]
MGFKGLNKSVVVGILSTLTLAACSNNGANKSQIAATSTNDSAIINGTVVSAQEALSKNIVGIFSRHDGEDGVAICTGSLLKGNLVLTAAHCVDDFMYIVFSTDMDSAVRGQVLAVDKVAVSPYWSSRQNADKDHGDVALVHFVGTAPSDYTPATLLNDTSVLKNGASVVLAGYGANEVTRTPIDTNTYPDLVSAVQAGKVICDDPKALTNCAEVDMPGAGVLRKTSVTIEDAKFAQSEVLLNQRNGTGACHGDSGGPAYATVNGQLYLWGVTSRGERDPNNDCSQYSVYTNAVFYKSWLNSVAQKLTASSSTLQIAKK